MMEMELVRYNLQTFRDFLDLPENTNRRFEMLEGVIYEMASPTVWHGLIALRIAMLIAIYLETHPIGYPVGDNNDFELDEDTVLKPDAAFVSYARQPQIPKKYYQIAPDLAVEVISPSNTAPDIMKKVELYIQHGSRLVWVIYPTTQTIYVYRPLEDGSLNLRKLTLQDELDGGEVLPDFRVPVAKCFPAY